MDGVKQNGCCALLLLPRHTLLSSRALNLDVNSNTRLHMRQSVQFTWGGQKDTGNNNYVSCLMTLNLRQL